MAWTNQHTEFRGYISKVESDMFLSAIQNKPIKNVRAKGAVAGLLKEIKKKIGLGNEAAA
jgi:hypothetical protein